MLSAKPWKPASALMVCALFCLGFGVIGLSSAAALKMSGKTEIDHGSLLYLFLVSLSMHGPILLATALVLYMQHIRWSDAFGFANPGKGKAVLWGVFAALIFLPIAYLAKSASVTFLQWADHAIGLHIDVSKPQEAVAVLTNQQSVGAKIYAAFFAIVIAPVAEEILFRGILYPTIKQAGYPRIALWSTAMVFAAIHLDFQIFVPLTILGLMQVFLYERTDTLLAPITAHSLFNFFGVVATYSTDIGNFFLRLFHHQS